VQLELDGGLHAVKNSLELPDILALIVKEIGLRATQLCRTLDKTPQC
jgi:hypothetical protein